MVIIFNTTTPYQKDNGRLDVDRVRLKKVDHFAASLQSLESMFFYRNQVAGSSFPT